MNRPLRQVLIAYAISVAVACIYVPWQAQPEIAAVTGGYRRYDLLWRPPQTIGYHHSLDNGRLLLEISSLSVILLIAVRQLGEKG